MRRSLVHLLVCPDCRSAVEIGEEIAGAGDEIEEGMLHCTGCGARFPIEFGIPRMMPAALLDAQRDEMKARDEQVEQYDANTFLNLFGKIEVPLTVGRLAPTLQDTLLEAGCGTGRMTPVFAEKVREQVSVDFSFASLRVCRAKLQGRRIENVHLVQADLCRLPLAEDTFDRIVSCQVLEHIPSADARKSAVGLLGRAAKPGATAVISGYRYSRLMGAKQGRHDGGIPFFRFSRQEFVDLLGGAFEVRWTTGALGYLYLAQCVRPSAQCPGSGQ